MLQTQLEETSEVFAWYNDTIWPKSLYLHKARLPGQDSVFKKKKKKREKNIFFGSQLFSGWWWLKVYYEMNSCNSCWLCNTRVTMKVICSVSQSDIIYRDISGTTLASYLFSIKTLGNITTELKYCYFLVVASKRCKEVSSHVWQKVVYMDITKLL